eukprot:GFUD01050943.1.p1 GENE.GFUD01050943.1~~GFUD01050943.1.p1  ORF type:complete len:105 (-),score=18.35 GFUD01050943.1:183-497(-)
MSAGTVGLPHTSSAILRLKVTAYKHYFHQWNWSFIVKIRKSRFGFKRRLKSKVSGSTVSLGEYKYKPTMSKQTPRNPPQTSQSLDGGRSRLPLLKFSKKIFKKK